VAKVYDKFLYPSDLEHIFSNVVSEKDSMVIAKNYIENWVKEQLLLKKAEANLSEEQKDVKRQLDNYRTSLLIYKFEEEHIRKNIDTIISMKEIEQYYNENQQNFILENTIIKAVYIKISKNTSFQDVYNVRRWYRSDKEEDEKLLNDFCVQYAEVYDNFNDGWITFTLLQSQFPRNINNPNTYFRYNRFLETQDTSYRYFIRINDFRPKSDVAPLDYVEQRIKNIILNKRKITLIQDLENSVYNEAMNRENIKVF
jgi:hypothetical protein